MRRADRLWIHGLFFASGATALVYQVAWVRSLSLILGASHQAVSIVLAAFMGGLALGAVVIARRAAGHAHPLRLYGWLELGIAASALALPLLLRVVQAVYVALALGLEDRAGGEMLAAAARVLLSFGVLVLPTFLMGGTLPVLVSAVVQRHGELHARLASLYAINTAGAAAGALAAGFTLLPALGLRHTELAAVACNVLIGAAALWLGRAGAPADAATQADPADDAAARRASAPATQAEATALRVVFACTAICGFGALALEVMWTRAISLVIGSSVYSFTVMLVAFLSGIALGSALHSALPRRLSEPAHATLLLLGIAVSTLVTSLAIPRLPELVGWLKPGAAGAGFDPWTALALCFLVMLVPCVLHGMAFPLAGEARARLEARTARSVGDLVGLNTFGSIAGSLGAGFVLIPQVGMQRSLVGISALYASAGIAVAGAALATAGRRRPVAAGAVAAIALGWLGVFSLRAWDTRLLGSFRNNEVSDLRRVREEPGGVYAEASVLYYREGRGSTVSVVEDAAGVRRFQIDGKVEASDATSDLRHELLLGHLPVLAHPAPRSALVVGLGAGITLGGVAAHPEIESITIVEIEPAVVPVSSYFAHVNGNPLEDPRVRLVIQDGRNHLLTTSQRFDVITADPIHPWARGSAYLYTREYYETARARLEDGGVMCQWLPLYQLSPDDLRAAVGSFVDVFPDATLWSTPADAVLIGSTRPLRIDLGAWQQRLAHPRVQDGLARVGLADPLSLLAEFTLSSEAMRGFAQGATRNTDDNLFLEFDSPRHIGGGSALLQNNARLLASLASPTAEIVGDVAPLFGSEQEAVHALEGVVAAKAALARVIAQDLDVQARLGPLRAIAQGPPRYGPAQDELAWQLRLAGRAAMQQGDVAAAVAAFDEATRLAPLDWRSRVELAWALRRNGDLDAAEPALREALRLAPHAPPAHYELAVVLLQTSRRDEAIAQFRAAALSRPGWADPRNDLAWLLATDPGSTPAARAEAVALAESAATLSGHRDPMILDTLAVAYAVAGHPDALETARQALAIAREAQPDLVPKLEARSAALARGDLEAALLEDEEPNEAADRR